MEQRRAWWVAVFFIAMPMIMLYPLWGDPLSAGEDDAVYYFPLRMMVASELRSGHWPMNNPREATGVPLMADPQSALMHPTTWLFAAMDGHAAYALSLFAAFSLAGGGAYSYLRRLGLVRGAAVLGGTAFMFCGFMVGHRVHQSIILAAAMLPWGLWCIEGLRRQPEGGGVAGPSARRQSATASVLWLVPTVFLAVAAGHLPTFVHLCIIWGVYLLLRGRPLPRAMAAGAAGMAPAILLYAPQLCLTAGALAGTTRQKLGFAMASENSFFPAAAVLAVFPHFMGSRTPNFFGQQWWGPWHLCEMLGYVGLLTLGLAIAAVWGLYRKRSAGCVSARAAHWDRRRLALTGVVRPWTWIIVGAGVFMLGGYLPPLFKLVQMVPVLGDVVRCPARMVLAVDMGLATLAAATVHAVACCPRPLAAIAALRRRAVGAVSLMLPIAMAAFVAGFAACGALLFERYPQRAPFLDGGAPDMIEAARLTNPAVWVQIVVLAAAVAAVVWWIARPRRRLAVLTAVLLADLFFVTRFVDFPAESRPHAPASPAAAWLKAHGPADRLSYRIWALGVPLPNGQLSYHDRADELLLPKMCEAAGFATIGNYGPLQSPAHAQLFGFRIWGACRDWPALLRRNYPLSLYGVKYVLTADDGQRAVIESVRVGRPTDGDDPDEPASAPAAELAGGEWSLDQAACADGVVTLRAPWIWRHATADRQVTVEHGRRYAIAFDARAPQGAAGYLRAELLCPDADAFAWDDPLGPAINVEPDQLGPQWRHFEHRFVLSPGSGGRPAGEPYGPVRGRAVLRLDANGERAIEVRNVSLRVSTVEQPANIGGRLKDGDRVYRRVANLPAVRPGEPDVTIYENRLCAPPGAVRFVGASAAGIESFKWNPPDLSGQGPWTVPDVSLPAGQYPTRLLAGCSLPALAIWAAMLVVFIRRRRRLAGGFSQTRGAAAT